LHGALQRCALLEQERETEAELQLSAQLVRSASGSLQHAVAAGGSTPDPAGPSGGGAHAINRQRRLVVSENVGASRPRHVLRPSASVARRGLSALLNGSKRAQAELLLASTMMPCVRWRPPPACLPAAESKTPRAATAITIPKSRNT
jgi:hypothetical protein